MLVKEMSKNCNDWVGRQAYLGRQPVVCKHYYCSIEKVADIEYTILNI